MKIILAIVILILLYLLFGQMTPEGYDNIPRLNAEANSHRDDYYLWRAFPDDWQDNYARLKRFPFTYQPYDHPGEFDRIYPYFYEYGYGSF